MDFLERNKALFAEIEEKIAKDPQNVENYLILGKLYVMGGLFDKAIDVYGELLKIDPLSTQALVNTGSIYFFKKEYTHFTGAILYPQI